MTKKRERFTHAERIALREEHALAPLKTLKDLCVWFETRYKKRIGVSTVSESLSTRFAHLDGSTVSKALKAAKASHTVRSSEFEKALFEWQVRAETSVTITGEILKQKAIELWSAIPSTSGLKEPVFSNGWLEKFKKRCGIKYRP